MAGLVGLTFGSDEKAKKESIEVIHPDLKKNVDENKEPIFRILKVVEIIGSPLYLVGKVESGIIEKEMTVEVNGKDAMIEDIDSKAKFANYAVEGMTVGITISKLNKGDVSKDLVLKFKKWGEY